jgi:hypothetical protein
MESKGNSSAPKDPSTDDSSAKPEPREAFDAMREHLAELGEYLSHFANSKIDLGRLYFRQWIMRMSLLAIGLLAAAGLIVTAGVLICVGIASGLSKLFGQPWLGEMVTGVGLFAVVAIVVQLSVAKTRRERHDQMVQEFDDRRQRQQERFGHGINSESNQQKLDANGKPPEKFKA